MINHAGLRGDVTKHKLYSQDLASENHYMAFRKYNY